MRWRNDGNKGKLNAKICFISLGYFGVVVLLLIGKFSELNIDYLQLSAVFKQTLEIV